MAPGQTASWWQSNFITPRLSRTSKNPLVAAGDATAYSCNPYGDSYCSCMLTRVRSQGSTCWLSTRPFLPGSGRSLPNHCL